MERCDPTDPCGFGGYCPDCPNKPEPASSGNSELLLRERTKSVGYDDINPGDKWVLKSNPEKIAEVTMVERASECFGGAMVELQTPWIGHGYTRKTLDVLVKQYDPVAQ